MELVIISTKGKNTKSVAFCQGSLVGFDAASFHQFARGPDRAIGLYCKFLPMVEVAT